MLMTNNLMIRPTMNKVFLVVAPHAAREYMREMISSLALVGPVRVFDGGNQFDAYRIAKAIRRQSADLHQILNRIRLSRAFSCYQMVALMSEACSEKSPLLVLDLLATFFDEAVSLGEARRLLQIVIRHLDRLSQDAPVVVSVRPSRYNPERNILLADIEKMADEVLELFVYSDQASEKNLAKQPSLF
jgi:hypothetical protein